MVSNLNDHKEIEFGWFLPTAGDGSYVSVCSSFLFFIHELVTSFMLVSGFFCAELKYANHARLILIIP